MINDFELILPGYESDLKNGLCNHERILNDENISLTDFKVSSYPEISCKGGLRKALTYPKNFKIIEIKKDYYTISFELEKSAYATMILKELVG